jgi:hypothetical protein
MKMIGTILVILALLTACATTESDNSGPQPRVKYGGSFRGTVGTSSGVTH